MKHIILTLYIFLPAYVFADIIATYKNGNIENVMVVSVNANEVVYKIGNTQKSIPSSQVEGVLFNDGRYISPPKNADGTDLDRFTSDGVLVSEDGYPSKNQSTYSSYPKENEHDEWDENQSERNKREYYSAGDMTSINVYAFGNYIKLYYLTDHTYDGTIVEYRVIYKGLTEPTDWSYLGTTPFAYITSKGGINPLISKDAKKIAEVQPLEIENFKQAKKVEFRLSNEEYGTIVVSPLIQMDVTGLYYFISLNKLKKGNKKTSPKQTDSYQSEDDW